MFVYGTRLDNIPETRVRGKVDQHRLGTIEGRQRERLNLRVRLLILPTGSGTWPFWLETR